MHSGTSMKMQAALCYKVGFAGSGSDVGITAMQHRSNTKRLAQWFAHPTRQSLHSSDRFATWIFSRVQCVGQHSHHTTCSKVITTSFVSCIKDVAPHQLTCSSDKPAAASICLELQLSDTIKQIEILSSDAHCTQSQTCSHSRISNAA